MKRVLNMLFVAIAVITAGCSHSKSANNTLLDSTRYKIVQHQIETRQLTERLILTKPMPKDTLIILLKDRISSITNTTSVKRIFVYVYDEKTDAKNLNNNWSGMADNQSHQISLHVKQFSMVGTAYIDL